MIHRLSHLGHWPMGSQQDVVKGHASWHLVTSEPGPQSLGAPNTGIQRVLQEATCALSFKG